MICVCTIMEPLLTGCFCDGCFRKLSEYFGFHGSRREFAGFFDRGSAEELRERRLKMLEWNRQVLASAFIFIRQTVHEVNPDIILGKMDCLDLWESDRRRQASLLGGEGGGSVWWRPGGGAYCDTDLEELIRKADTIAAEAAMLPPVVTVIQSELENFPYSRLQKSTSFTALETSLYCAAGCTGTALNLLGDPASAPPECYEPYLLELKEQRRFNDKIVRLNRGRPLPGNLVRKRIRIIFWAPKRISSGAADFPSPETTLPAVFRRWGCRMRMLRNMRFAALCPAVRPALFPMRLFCRCFPPADILTPMPSGC